MSSWVQSQLQNHPDELWEDGVNDYLTHASSILVEYFSYTRSRELLNFGLGKTIV